MEIQKGGNTEIWKTISGYEDYQVSNLGRVKSLKKHKGVTERILKPTFNKGYLQVCLRGNFGQSVLKVHKIVAIAFLSHKPCGQKVVVDHINNIKTDNRLENLQLISNRDNSIKDKSDVGAYFMPKKKKWKSLIWFKKPIYLGVFDTKKQALAEYNRALNEIKTEDKLTRPFVKPYKNHESRNTRIQN